MRLIGKNGFLKKYNWEAEKHKLLDMYDNIGKRR
jgi:hypothetical protein